MRWKNNILPIFIFLVALATIEAGATERIPIFVSIAPQKYFVQQIGGDRVAVTVMVAPAASPATYEPTPRQMAALSRARAYFAVGAPFEGAWLAKFAAVNPRMRLVHTDRDIRKRPMAGHAHAEAGRPAMPDHEAAHHHDGLPDPHVWLAPPLVMLQARAILGALQDLDPAHHDRYAANYRAFVADLVDLDLELRQVFAGKHGRRFMVFHPSWGYFARAYGIRQVPIEIEGKTPKPAQLRRLVDHARDEGIRVVFVQPQFSTRSAELVAREIGGRVAYADPLAADWAANLRRVAQAFAAVIE